MDNLGSPARWRVLLAVSTCMFGLLAGVTMANAHGGDATFIHACVAQRGGDDDDDGRPGSVRIVGPNDACKRDEAAIHWSITGPQGAQGSPGPQGPQGPAGPPGDAGPPLALTVNCGQGESIANALLNGGAAITITVQGTCNENVTITRDDVTLQGDPATGGGVTAANPAQTTILIDGPRRVVIHNLTVSGGRNGIVVARSASATVRNSSVRNNSGDGIAVVQTSRALIHENLVEDNGAVGVLVHDGSSATITLNTVRRSGEEGILAANSSSMRVGRTDTGGAAGNTIENNAIDGLSVTRGSVMELLANVIRNNTAAGVSAIQNSTIRSRGGNTVQSNGGCGIFLRSSNLRAGPGDIVSDNTASGLCPVENSDAEIRDAMTLSGNAGHGIFLEHGARLLARSATISGNGGMGIVLRRASSIRLVGPPVTITGNGTSGFFTAYGLFCEDSESSFEGAFLGEGAPGGTIGPGCTDFGQVAPGP